MKKKFLAILFLLFVAVPVQAKCTKLDTLDKRGEIHCFDSETIQKNGQLSRVWVLSSYDERQKGGHHAVKTLYEFDCIHYRARSITMLLYPDKNATGKVIGARHKESQDWFGFSDNSMFWHIVETICID